jgi:hypothetical protein
MQSVILFIFVLCCCQAQGQTWTMHAEELGINHSVSVTGQYGAGVSFYDVNQDGWDDLTLCHNELAIKLYLNNQGTFDNPIDIVANDQEVKQVTWVDYDNDGDPDLFVTRRLASFMLFQNDGNLNLTEVTETAGFPFTSILTFGHTWGDYDRDGWLDVYICNYNGSTYTNLLFHNNGNGTFTDVTENLDIGDESCNSFQPNFIDVNNDLWPDLFIANDRENCRNSLYLNTQGSFTDVSEISQINGYFFAMNNTAADYDHDGDLDIYVTNNPFGNKFYLNDGEGYFSEQAENLGVATFDHSWSAQWVDFDNNTWEDLHVCCSPFWGQPGQNRFYENLGTGAFSDITMLCGLINDEGWSHSSAVGDFNNDGFPDIFVVNDAPDLSEMYASSMNENNFVKVLLEGTLSNRDGVGSWIDLYANNTHQRKYTHCGEGYLAQNSRTEHFGLGNASLIDSLIISWPSGFQDVWFGLDANNTYQLIEGSSLLYPISSESLYLCGNDSILLISDINIEDEILWSTGSMDTSIYVSIPGDYFYEVTNELGITSYSDTTTIYEASPFSISLSTTESTCSHLNGGNIIADINGETGISEIMWDDQISNQLDLIGVHEGWHSIYLLNDEGCSFFDSIFLSAPDSLMFSFVVNHPSCGLYGSVESTISGGAGGYVLNWGGLNPSNSAGGNYAVSVQDMNGCQLDTVIAVNMGVQNLNTFLIIYNANNGSNGSAQLNISGGTPPYSIEWQPINIFDLLIVDELSQGSYLVYVEDSLGCTDSIDFSIIDVGIPNTEVANFQIYPNPFSNSVSIQAQSVGEYEVIVFSNNGQKVSQAKFNSELLLLDMSQLRSGIYSIVVYDVNGVFLTKHVLTKY